MRTYFTTRWGHPESEFGPDGGDTNFLVRARSVEEAAAVTDAFLANLPTSSPHSRREVQPFCHHIVELGVEESESSEPNIIHGPWIAHAILRVSDYPAWSRSGFDEAWTNDQ